VSEALKNSTRNKTEMPQLIHIKIYDTFKSYFPQKARAQLG